MTSKPETVKGTATTEATPEGEYRGWAGAGAGAEAEPTAEPTAEPQPEWDIAVETWGVAWEFHQYGLGALFGVISLLAFVALVKLFKMDRGARQKKVSFVVLSQIFIFGSSRCLFLCIDAYHSKKHFSESDESTLGNWTALFDYSVHADFLSVAKCFSDEKQISNLVYDKKHNFGYSSLLHLRVHI